MPSLGRWAEISTSVLSWLSKGLFSVIDVFHLLSLLCYLKMERKCGSLDSVEETKPIPRVPASQASAVSTVKAEGDRRTAGLLRMAGQVRSAVCSCRGTQPLPTASSLISPPLFRLLVTLGSPHAPARFNPSVLEMRRLRPRVWGTTECWAFGQPPCFPGPLGLSGVVWASQDVP